MKKMVFVIFVIGIFAGISLAQSRVKKSNLGETDRKRWFKVLKWDSEDAPFSHIVRFENSGITFFELGRKRYLVEIITGAGEYQRSYVFALLDENNWRKPTATLLNFTTYLTEETGEIKKETSPY